MICPRYLIGFTGHRHDVDDSVVRPVLAETLKELQARARELGGTADLYTSIAEGGDVLCVEVARELKIPIHLLLPLPEAECRRDFASDETWSRSLAQLEPCRLPGPDSIHEAPGASSRPECYFNLGVTMLEAVDILVALWDGEEGQGIGGTANVVELAQVKGIPVIQIHPVSGTVSGKAEALDHLHRDPVIEEIHSLAKKSQIACDGGAEDPKRLQACMDDIANREAARFRPSKIRIILLQSFAAVLAAIVSFRLTEPDHWFTLYKWVFTAMELVLVVFALVLAYRLRCQHTQDTWLRCRFACERVRALRASVPLLDPLHPLITRFDPTWRRFELSAGLLIAAHQVETDPFRLRDRYIAMRLGQDPDDSQLLHYQKKQPRAERRWKLAGGIGWASTTLAPAVVLLALLNKLSRHWRDEGWALDEHFETWILVGLLPIVLPLAAGVAKSLQATLDAGRRRVRYPQMVASLTAAVPWLASLKSRTAIVKATTQTEELLLDELLEWKRAMKKSGGS